MLSREIFVWVAILLGVAWTTPAEGRVRNVPVEKRWSGETRQVDPPMFSGNIDVRQPGNSPFRGGRNRGALDTMSRFQTSANRAFSPLQKASTYTRRLNLDEEDGRFSVEDRFDQPLFLKNPRESVEIGSGDVVNLPMSRRWNETFSDFVDWWAPDYEAAMEPDAEELSLQDINRYQFRRSHSSEPGVPVRTAGSEG